MICLVVFSNKVCVHNAPINVNPVGGGSAGKGRGFDGEVHPLSGRFDRVTLLGGRDILFFRQTNWDQD